MRVRFGGLEVGHTSSRPGDVLVSEFDPGYPEVTSSDVARDGRDGLAAGRDFLGLRSLSFDLSTNRSTMVQARETLRLFLAAWRDASVRLAAGRLVPLEFQVSDDPRWRRVYGRPRRSDDPDFGVLMRAGFGRVSVDFDVLEPRTFSAGPEGEFSARVGQVEGSVGGGRSLPSSLPSRGAPIAGTRVGSLTVGGDVSTPAVIEFHGPGRGLSLDGNRGWHAGLRSDVTLAADEVITFDPLAGTAVDNFGRPRYAALDRRTPLDGVELSPGTENVFFSAVDETRQAHTVIRWREAFMSL